AEADGTITDEPGAPERILAPLLTAALDNALRYGDRALTGPVARGDAAAVSAHLRAMEDADPAAAESYRALALRTAQRVHAAPDLFDALTGRPDPAVASPGTAGARNDSSTDRQEQNR